MTTIASFAETPTGASLAWTSDEPVIVRARELISAGELAKAEAMLKGAGGGVAVDETLEVIRRIRRDYPHGSQKMFDLLRPKIDGLRIEELDAWRKAGELQYRMIDGQVAYFRREPSNLFRFCPDAMGRRVSQPVDKSDSVLIEHLVRVIDEARRTGRTEVLPIRHEVHFTLTVPANAAGAKPGSVARAWLPYPQAYRQQSDVELISAGPGKPVVAENGQPHRSLYFEQRVNDPGQPSKFEATYAYTSHAYYPVLDDAKVQPLPADFPGDQFLAERPPHWVFSPKLKQTVAQIIGPETNPLAKARKIFHWVDANIRYNAEEEYSIIPSFSEHALARRRGDCGIQASLFITMCRAAGVPARWQSGWQTIPAGNHNMHDWAEIYVAPWGWLPCDPSYGLKRSNDPAVREFYFGHQDAFRMIVNHDIGRPFQPEKKSLRSEPADFQVGEVEIDGRNLFFDQFDSDFAFTQRTP
jgi:transglutaminase-like putative cysteine protease